MAQDLDTTLKAQAILNRSYDDTNKGLRTIEVAQFPATIDASNPTTTLSFNSLDQLLKIEKTVGSTTYLKPVTDSSVTDTTVARTIVFGYWR